MSNVKASIITIGDELLIGQTIDTNSAWIAQQLNPLGIDVVRRVAVADKKSAIREALDYEIPKTDVVLVTGGLGPTADDITKPFLCEYFGGKLVVNEHVLAHVKHLFEVRKRPFLERNMKQAEVPDNCTVLHNKMGTAPGMLFKRDSTIIISMPGVPFEMMSIMEDEVLPILKRDYLGHAIVHRTLITAGEGESFIAERLKEIEEALPDYIKLAYLPSAGIVKLRLTGAGEETERLEKELSKWQAKMKKTLDNITIADEDLTLEEIVGNSLLERSEKLGLVESCTGGYIAHLITRIEGSSRYFQGGIVPYQDEIKHDIVNVDNGTLATHGAISEQAAIELAENGREKLNADYCLSVTGLLSASIGVKDVLPIGTVWMAISGANGTRTKKFKFHYDRTRNKEMATNMGLLMILKYINGDI